MFGICGKIYYINSNISSLQHLDCGVKRRRRVIYCTKDCNIFFTPKQFRHEGADLSHLCKKNQTGMKSSIWARENSLMIRHQLKQVIEKRAEKEELWQQLHPGRK